MFCESRRRTKASIYEDIDFFSPGRKMFEVCFLTIEQHNRSGIVHRGKLPVTRDLQIECFMEIYVSGGRLHFSS